MSKPLFSILTPTYNCARYIRRSYEFLKNQTESSWEWIIVDDGSNDETQLVLQELNDDRVLCIINSENRGRGYSRNVGLLHASGKFIVVWDVDDVYFPNRLMVIKEYLDDYDFFVSSAIVVDNFFNIKGLRSFSHNGLYTGFVHPTLAFKSSIKARIRYDESMRAGEDLESMIFLTNRCKGFYHTEPLMLYVEDREINIEKTLLSNKSHYVSIKRAYDENYLKIGYLRISIELFKLKVKILVLNLLRFYPSLYFFTVRFRSLEKNLRIKPDYLVEIERYKSNFLVKDGNS
jgi:glycosyltransferase involved in cell wall biosynthesis